VRAACPRADASSPVTGVARRDADFSFTATVPEHFAGFQKPPVLG
jgi:hypothetical protein